MAKNNFECGDVNPLPANQVLQRDFQIKQKEYDAVYNNTQPETYREIYEEKRRILKKKEQAKKCNPLVALAAGLLLQRLCRCPVCNPCNKVKDKVAGKNYFKIPFTNLKIPRLDHIFDKSVTFDQNRRPGEKCGVCGGKKTIPDVTDDTIRYQQAAAAISSNSEKLMETEAKLGLGGTRTTVIQGSDMLFVGLGFNNNKTYEVLPDANVAPTMRGGKIPQQNGMPVNAVVGKQGSLAWPQQVGNYAIKCANKFSLLAGAGGITIATPGPLTISAGIMKIIGPQLTIGSSSGPLTMEGDSVNVTGRAVSITPTGGELFVKGNINNTGNVTCQGHAHFESMSFTKASCVTTTKQTYMANANVDVTQTQPASWTGFALGAALLDLQTYYQNILTDAASSAFRLLSLKEQTNIADRLTSIAKYAMPLEALPTGFILPGMAFVIGSCSLGGTVAASNPGLIPLHNFPHTHGLPEMMHKHEVTLPDIDYSVHTPKGLRQKVLNGMHESGVPANPTKDTFARLMEVKKVAIEFAAALPAEAMKLAAKVQRLFT
jgi:hypothetical protein